MDVQLSKTLARWAKNSPEKTSQLETWLDSAIADVAAGNGAQVQSTSANGVSVSFANGLTVAAWAATLSLAIQFLETPPVSQISARIR